MRKDHVLKGLKGDFCSDVEKPKDRKTLYLSIKMKALLRAIFMPCHTSECGSGNQPSSSAGDSFEALPKKGVAMLENRRK